MRSSVRVFLRDTPTPALIALPASSWESWAEELYCSQELSRPLTAEDLTTWRNENDRTAAYDDSLEAEELTRDRRIVERRLVELSALGTLVHDEEWSGVSLLCNWAPTPFEIDGEIYASIDTFHHALKFPEGSAERHACASLKPTDAQRMARRVRAKTFTYGGSTIVVGSTEHRSLFARAVCARLSERTDVQMALRATCWSKLEFPLTYTEHPNVPGLVTPLCLMIERFKRWGPRNQGLAAETPKDARG